MEAVKTVGGRIKRFVPEGAIAIKLLRSDSAGEFTSKKVKRFCAKHGIFMQPAVHSPEDNGKAERYGRKQQKMETALQVHQKIYGLKLKAMLAIYGI